MKIQSKSQFLEALERGPFAWPGGYPTYFVTWDGSALSFESAQENSEIIEEAHDQFDATSQEGDDWLVIAQEINWEDDDLYCVDTGAKIPCAYGEDKMIKPYTVEATLKLHLVVLASSEKGALRIAKDNFELELIEEDYEAPTFQVVGVTTPDTIPQGWEEDNFPYGQLYPQRSLTEIFQGQPSVLSEK